MPQIGPGEVLIQVQASGVCGSDVMEWYRLPKAPTVLGHEIVGLVVAVGDDVRQVSAGDRIVATHHVPCLVCRYCLSGRETMCEMLRRTSFDPGGFAEYIRLPAVNVERGVLKLPDHVSDAAGSFVEPLGCVVRAQRKAGIEPGDSLLIIGAGVSGLLHVMAARATGVTNIFVSEPRSNRRDMAIRLGADAAHEASDPVPKLVRQSLGGGVNRVILTTGARGAIDQALESVDRGGTVFFFAPMGPSERYALPFNDVFWRNDVTLTSSYGAGPRDLALALHLISSCLVDVTQLVTHRLLLSQTQKAFEMMVQGNDSLKIIIDPRLEHEPAASEALSSAAPFAHT